MDFNTTEALKLFNDTYRDSEVDSPFVQQLENAIEVTKTKMQLMVGDFEFERICNTPDTFGIVSEDGYHTYDNTDFDVPLLDYICATTSIKRKRILAVGDGLFKIAGGITDTEVALASIKNYYIGWSWLLLYNLTFTAKEIMQRVISADYQGFGDGDVSAKVVTDRQKFLNNASDSFRVARSPLDTRTVKKVLTH